MTQKQKKEVDKIVAILRTQEFYDFYVNDKPMPLFDKYLIGRNTNDKLKNDVEEKIKTMFGIK